MNQETEQGSSQINILLADDQHLFTENLKLMLETLTEDIKIIGIASNGEEAISLAEQRNPDILLMDVRMPVMDGVEATKIIHQKFPKVKIVMLTTFLDDRYVEEALKYGSYGYILKTIRPGDLIASLRAIFSGSFLFSPGIINKFIMQLNQNNPDEESMEEYREIISQFTHQENKILKLIGEGYNNKKIADALYISEPTVRNYISSIYAKIGSKDRLKLISIVRKIKNAAQ